jgi:hypothetical protein
MNRRLTSSSLVRLKLSIAATALAGLLLAAASSAWVAAIVMLAVGCIATTAIAIATRLRAGAFDLLEPIVGGSIVLAIMFGVRPIAMLIAGDFTYRGSDIRPEFPYVVALGLIGNLAFVWASGWVGVRTARNSRTGDAEDGRLEPALIYPYIAVLTVLSLVLFGVHLSRLGSGLADGLRLFAGGSSPELIQRWAGTTEYLSASPILASCAAILLGIATSWRLKPYQIALVLMLIAYPLMVFYVSGDRRYLIPSVGVPLVAWMLMSGRRPPRRVLLLAVPVAFAVLTAIPFVRWGAAQENSGGLAAALVQGLGNPVRAVDRFILGPDTSMISALAIEVRVIREPTDLTFGRATVGDLLLAPIPHLLISDKPQTARDELLIRAFGTPCSVTALGVCDDFSVVGTGYQDFWIVGVGGLLAAIGAGSAALWSRWRRSRTNPRLIVVLSPLIVFLPIVFRAGFMPAAAWCLYFLVPCLIGVLISIRRLKPTRVPLPWTPS